MNRWMKTKPSASKGTADTLKHRHNTPASFIMLVDARPLLFRSDELMAKPQRRPGELSAPSRPAGGTAVRPGCPFKRRKGSRARRSRDPGLSRGDTAALRAAAAQKSGRSLPRDPSHRSGHNSGC